MFNVTISVEIERIKIPRINGIVDPASRKDFSKNLDEASVVGIPTICQPS